MKLILSLSVLSFGFWELAFDPTHPPQDSVSLGRQTYVAEGCINCHSQYSRPHSPDLTTSGPSYPINRESGSPILIGNRRQGPDLSNIGARRSREWNRIHLIHPQTLSPDSRMPNYAFLFTPGHDHKGEALLDYLAALVAADSENWWKTVYNWSPEISATGNRDQGAKLFQANCAQCHGPHARGDGTVRMRSANFELDLDLADGNHRFVPRSMDPTQRFSRVAQLIKYGLPGTSMPGHEYLTDQNVIDLMTYLDSLSLEEIEH